MTLRFRPQVSTVDTEYGTVLLDERTGRYWQLNPTGAAVVRMLRDGREPEDVVAALTEEYDVAAEQARCDVAALVDSLRSAALVVT